MPEPSIRLRWMDAILDTPNDGQLDAYARAVAFALYRHMDNKTGQVRVGTRRLAAEAGVSHNVAEGRVARLESAGWLTVERQPGLVNQYRATVPTAPPHSAPTAPQDSAVLSTTAPPDGAQMSTTAPSQAETAPRGGAKPLNQQPPPLQEDVTHEEAASEGKGPITPKRILSEMARRRLTVLRQQSSPIAPPEGCDPRRETGFLRAEVAALTAQHGFALDALIARCHPEHPAKPKYADPDWYVWKLDPDLARRDWLLPTAEETQARHAAERAAWALDTPEKVEANRAGREAAMALRDELREARERRARRVSA